MAVGADVSVRSEVERMFTEVREVLGDPEILVNNAESLCRRSCLRMLPMQNGTGFLTWMSREFFYCIQAALPAMIRRKQGKIINISSMWGQVGASCEVPYSAAKGAVIALTKALAQEVGPSGIQVNCVAPGVIDTEMNGNLPPEAMEALQEEIPLGVLGKPSDVAEAVAFLASEGANFITGQVMCPNGGMVL